MLNRIVMEGRLTHDPELRRTQNGTAVTTITLACDRDHRPKDGEEKQTDFIDVVAWGATAEFVTKYFLKGRMAIVDGHLQSRKWQDKTGQNRVSWEVLANSVYFGDSKRTASTDAEASDVPDVLEDGYAGTADDNFAEIAENGETPF